MADDRFYFRQLLSGRDFAADDPLARDDDGNRVFAVGCADRSRCARLTHQGRLLAVGSGLTIGDFQKRRPRAFLEWRSSEGFDRDRENLQLPTEVGVELSFGELQDRMAVGFNPCFADRGHVLPVAKMHLGQCALIRDE